MERLKKTNQTRLLVVGFLTAIIPAFTFTEKLYNGSNLVFYSTLIEICGQVCSSLCAGCSLWADVCILDTFFGAYYYFCMLLYCLFCFGSLPR